MPGNDQRKGRSDHVDTPDRQELPRVSRRSVLGAAGVGAAGLAAGAFGGLAAAQAATARPATSKPAPSHPSDASDASQPPQAGGHVVVHLPAASTGDLDVYHGASHTRVHDPDLAARLRTAAQ